MEENKCPQCGAPIDPDAKECRFCGEKIVVQQSNTANGISINIGNFSIGDEISALQKALAVSAHIGYLLGGIGFLLWPLGLYLFADKRMPFLAQHAVQAFKAQIAIIVLTAVVAMSAISGGGIIMIALACCVGGVLVPFSFYAAYKAINEQAYYYPLLNGGFTKKKAIILGGFLIALFLFSFALS